MHELEAGRGFQGGRIEGELAHERARTERIARQLGQEAMSQWSKAITGLIAVPTAIALGAASWALFAAGFIERGLEIFQSRAAAAMEDGRAWAAAGGEREGGRRTVHYQEPGERPGAPPQPRA